MILAIFLVSLLAISAASAADNTTEDIADVDDDVVSVEDNNQVTQQAENEKTGGVETDSDILSTGEEGNYTDLRNDIINGGILTKSTYYYRGGDGDTIQITESMTIDGKGAVIDMAGSTNMRVFYVDASDVIIKNLIIKNAKYDDGDGGAIYFSSSGTVENCNFVNNTALKDGGAIWMRAGSVENCNFVNNSVTADNSCGGAICMYLRSSVENCSFVKNSARDSGGAVYFNSASNVTNCNFTNNTASICGGAIQGYCTVTNCNFINNTASRSGGAINIYSGTVVNCNFINNKVNGDYSSGGAISGEGDVVNCNFINNTAISGGAIFGSKNVVNCNFTNNTAEHGGAFYSDDEDYSWDVINCIFTNNHADYGGAIYSEYYSDYDDIYGYDSYFNGYRCGILNCSFVNNTAKSSGAIDGAKDVVNCSFYSNNAIYLGGAVLGAENIENCLFINNSASGIYIGLIKDFVWYEGGEGGAISFAKNVANSTFINNSAAKGIIIGFNYLDSYLNNPIPKYFTEYELEHGGGYHVKNAESVGLFDCNIQEDAFNNYGGIELIGNELVLKLLSSHDEVALEIHGNEYAPYYEKSHYAHFDLSNLNEGSYNAHIYLRNSTYISEVRNTYDGIVEMTVPIIIKTKFDISASDVTKYCGGVEKYVVSLTKNNNPLANENVQISVNGKNSTVKTDSKGQASINLDLPVGTYDITSSYGNISTASKVTIKSTIVTTDAVGEYLNSKVSATFLNVDGKVLASKQVTFKIGDKTYTATTNSKGVATADVDLGVGTYTVTAINPVNNEQKQFKLVIDKANSAISLVSSQNNGIVTLTATLTPAAATGNVVFNVNGEDKTAAVKNGKATLTLSDLDPGDYAVTASYNGDKNLNVSSSNTVTFNVAEVYPILTADPVTKTYGTSTKLVVNLVDSKGNAIANADVSVVIGSATKHIKTDSNGQATMTISLKPATYTANITYLDAQTTAKINVKKATPKLTAKAKTFKKSLKTKKYTITLKTNTNKVMINTKVTLKVNGKTYKATTNSKGKATFKITKLTKKGKFNAVIKFAGNSYYKMVTKTIRITVKK